MLGRNFVSLAVLASLLAAAEAFSAQPNVALAGQSAVAWSPALCSARAIDDTETSAETGKMSNSSLFKFYLLEGGMCPYAGELTKCSEEGIILASHSPYFFYKKQLGHGSHYWNWTCRSRW